MRIDYGVLDLGLNGSPDRVVAYTEKPEVRSSVSIRGSILGPEALQLTPDEGSFDVPDLVPACPPASTWGPFSTRYSRHWSQTFYEAAAEAWAAVAEADDDAGARGER